MDLRQLRYFLAVAEQGQVTRAAKALNMEQPPLSRQLKLIEEELGVLLFDRSGRSFTLTAAGQLLKKRAEALLGQFDEALSEVKQLEEGLVGTLAIGSVVSCISLLPSRIREFGRRYPRVTYKIQEGDHFLLGHYLDTRQIELILSRLPFEAGLDEERYSIKQLPSDPFVAILPRSWFPSPPPSSLRMEDIAGYPFLTLKTDQTKGMHERVIKLFRAYGLAPSILCECSSVAIIIAFVAAGIGVTLLPRSVIASFPLNEIIVCDIPNTELQSEVGIVWLKDRYLSKSAQRFIEMFSEEESSP
ncbi:LysR family transcriptional regulator [Cohnella thailandensis]|uniref:LysR family transcriptional regulator n=1 Tax=Cohnella thailandensis TaxID=557557 RepID=A0A841SW58_9BACL|nr:LysR family transcriptional regulator [Cohnella thailandensis]MBB6634335.1 LysR family transcriptional regulator [Cohnella thailandensis]MBP1972166.1 DNA-binding transcriptional LysR family regulator [Cohnella thailandensis]